MDMFENFAVDIGEFESATTHDSGSDLHKSIYRDVGEAGFGAAILETGDKLTRETGAMEVDTDTDDGSGVEHTVDAGLGVVAHDKAAELEVGTHEALLVIIPDTDLGVIVFEIAGICQTLQKILAGVPGALNLLRHIRGCAETEDNGIIDFATHLAERAERRTAIDL